MRNYRVARQSMAPGKGTLAPWAANPIERLPPPPPPPPPPEPPAAPQTEVVPRTPKPFTAHLPSNPRPSRSTSLGRNTYIPGAIPPAVNQQPTAYEPLGPSRDIPQFFENTPTALKRSVSQNAKDLPPMPVMNRSFETTIPRIPQTSQLPELPPLDTSINATQKTGYEYPDRERISPLGSRNGRSPIAEGLPSSPRISRKNSRAADTPLMPSPLPLVVVDDVPTGSPIQVSPEITARQSPTYSPKKGNDKIPVQVFPEITTGQSPTYSSQKGNDEIPIQASLEITTGKSPTYSPKKGNDRYPVAPPRPERPENFDPELLKYYMDTLPPQLPMPNIPLPVLPNFQFRPTPSPTLGNLPPEYSLPSVKSQQKPPSNAELEEPELEEPEMEEPEMEELEMEEQMISVKPTTNNVSYKSLNVEQPNVTISPPTSPVLEVFRSPRLPASPSKVDYMSTEEDVKTPASLPGTEDVITPPISPTLIVAPLRLRISLPKMDDSLSPQPTTPASPKMIPPSQRTRSVSNPASPTPNSIGTMIPTSLANHLITSATAPRKLYLATHSPFLSCISSAKFTIPLLSQYLTKLRLFHHCYLRLLSILLANIQLPRKPSGLTGQRIGGVRQRTFDKARKETAEQAENVKNDVNERVYDWILSRITSIRRELDLFEEITEDFRGVNLETWDQEEHNRNGDAGSMFSRLFESMWGKAGQEGGILAGLVVVWAWEKAQLDSFLEISAGLSSRAANMNSRKSTNLTVADANVALYTYLLPTLTSPESISSLAKLEALLDDLWQEEHLSRNNEFLERTESEGGLGRKGSMRGMRGGNSRKEWSLECAELVELWEVVLDIQARFWPAV